MLTDQIAVIDVETTGLSPWRNDRIVEIAVVVISPTGQIFTEYETLLNPNRDIGPSRIHRICSADILRAPVFDDVAGDMLEILSSSNIIAGHNVSFDKNFIMKEYERIGITFPKIPLLCTYQLLGRNSLAGCCDEFGITTDGMPHRALTDARVTAQLITLLCEDNINILDNYRIGNINWPQLPPKRTSCYSREQSQQALDEPPRFLQRLADKIHHDVDGDEPNVLAYLALIDRVLEDRIIDADEENALVDAALEWKLSAAQIAEAHRSYIHNLAILALEDGVVSSAERHDLHIVAKLLGQNESALDSVLESAAIQLATAKNSIESTGSARELAGKVVCFTGELQAAINGQPITREIAEALAEDAGLIISNNVTKKLDILVVADPNTQSGKAKKARNYGIRILSDAVFWRMIGVAVD